MTQYHYACSSDFFYLGWGEGEKVATGVRVLSTMITISIMSSWCTKGNISRHRLFFAHWLSGLMHLLAKAVLGEMMRFCWLHSNVIVIIKSIKFIEVVSTNMMAATNLAICLNLALIIYSHRNVTQVRSLTSTKLVMVFLAVSVLVTVSAVPFWDEVLVSGAHVWVIGSTPDRNSWVISNHILLEFISGFVMMIIVFFLAVYRRPELRQVWRLHRRIQYYFGLTIIAIVTDLGIGIGGTLLAVNQYTHILMLLAFSCRNIHIALDTIVLYYGLGTTLFNIEGNSTVTSAPSEGSVNHAGDMPVVEISGMRSRMQPSSGWRSSANLTLPLDCTVPP